MKRNNPENITQKILKTSCLLPSLFELRVSVPLWLINRTQTNEGEFKS
jgi:hypothetical protein